MTNGMNRQEKYEATILNNERLKTIYIDGVKANFDNSIIERQEILINYVLEKEVKGYKYALVAFYEEEIVKAALFAQTDNLYMLLSPTLSGRRDLSFKTPTYRYEYSEEYDEHYISTELYYMLVYYNEYMKFDLATALILKSLGIKIQKLEENSYQIESLENLIQNATKGE